MDDTWTGIGTVMVGMGEVVAVVVGRGSVVVVGIGMVCLTFLTHSITLPKLVIWIIQFQINPCRGTIGPDKVSYCGCSLPRGS